MLRGVAVGRGFPLMCEGSVFIDWMRVGQKHPEDVAVVGDGAVIRVAGCEWVFDDDLLVVKLDKGEGFRYSTPSRAVKGSHSTQVRVWSDGANVTLSGNPGRFDRPDNVFSFGLEDTVRRASAIVQRVGLPAFSAGERLPVGLISERDAKLGLWEQYSGAVYRELHVTQNFAAGNEALAKEFMVWAGSQRAARVAKGVYGDQTVLFGRLAGKGRPLHKALCVYRKADELVAHAKGDEAKKAMKASHVYQFARDTGLVRVEGKWGSHFLRDQGLRFMGAATMAKVISIFQAETAFLLGASPERAVRLVSDMPPRLRLPALAWIRGDDIQGLVSRATYFRIVKGLREYGLDVSEPRRGGEPGKAEHDLQAMLDALPRFELRRLERPDWYELPDLPVAA